MDLERKAVARYARRARRRLAAVRSVEWGLRGLFYGLGAVLLWVLLWKLIALPWSMTWAAAGLGAVILGAGGTGFVFPRMDLLEAAGAADRQAGWKERLSSILALPAISQPMEHALLEDVRARLHERPPSQLFPWRAPRELKFTPLGILAIAAVMMLVPPLDLRGTLAKDQEKQKEKEDVKVAVEKLERRKKELEKAEQQSERVKEAVQKIDALAKALQQTPPPDKNDTLAQLSKLSDEIKDLKNDIAKSQSVAEKLQKAASKDTADLGELGRKMKEGKFREAAQELAKMRNALQEGGLSEKDREKLRKQMQALADQVGKDKDLSEYEEKLAKAMQGLDQGKEQMMDDLQQSLDSLDAGMDEERALADALKDLENLADALAQGKNECPSCGKKNDGAG